MDGIIWTTLGDDGVYYLEVGVRQRENGSVQVQLAYGPWSVFEDRIAGRN